MLTKFVQEKYVKFATEQSHEQSRPEVCKLLAQSLWECLTSGPALVDLEIQNAYASIYRTLYYYWAPLCYVKGLREKYQNQPSVSLSLTEFQIDDSWFTSEWH